MNSYINMGLGGMTYLSAYAIAVKHGFTGTEKEWLESLHGKTGELLQVRYNDTLSVLEYKYEGETVWQELVSLAGLEGDLNDWFKQMQALVMSKSQLGYMMGMIYRSMISTYSLVVDGPFTVTAGSMSGKAIPLKTKETFLMPDAPQISYDPYGWFMFDKDCRIQVAGQVTYSISGGSGAERNGGQADLVHYKSSIGSNVTMATSKIKVESGGNEITLGIAPKVIEYKQGDIVGLIGNKESNNTVILKEDSTFMTVDILPDTSVLPQSGDVVFIDGATVYREDGNGGAGSDEHDIEIDGIKSGNWNQMRGSVIAVRAAFSADPLTGGQLTVNKNSNPADYAGPFSIGFIKNDGTGVTGVPPTDGKIWAVKDYVYYIYIPHEGDINGYGAIVLNPMYSMYSGGGGSGTIFIPDVSTSGIISWTNDGGLVNPAPVSIKGPKGDTGNTGIQGLKGDKGDKGDTGSTGIQGIQGPEGPQGIKGDKGDKGDKGLDGNGFQILGLYPTLAALQAAHPSGSAGQAYAVGTSTDNDIYNWDVNQSAWVNLGKIQGPKGDKGDAGIQGPQGAQGIQGPVGPQGIKGDKGDKGDKGEKGDSGITGSYVESFNGRTGAVMPMYGDYGAYDVGAVPLSEKGVPGGIATLDSSGNVVQPGTGSSGGVNNGYLAALINKSIISTYSLVVDGPFTVTAGSGSGKAIPLKTKETFLMPDAPQISYDPYGWFMFDKDCRIQVAGQVTYNISGGSGAERNGGQADLVHYKSSVGSSVTMATSRIKVESGGNVITLGIAPKVIEYKQGDIVGIIGNKESNNTVILKEDSTFMTVDILPNIDDFPKPADEPTILDNTKVFIEADGGGSGSVKVHRILVPEADDTAPYDDIRGGLIKIKSVFDDSGQAKLKINSGPEEYLYFYESGVWTDMPSGSWTAAGYVYLVYADPVDSARKYKVINPVTSITGLNGTTFTPAVSSSGVISWTNDGGLVNPSSVNIKGPKGDKGDKGDTGSTGIQGAQGPTGAQGVKGDTGAQGIQGIQGPQGDKGDPGLQGPKGDTGPQGPPAADIIITTDAYNDGDTTSLPNGTLIFTYEVTP